MMNLEYNSFQSNVYCVSDSLPSFNDTNHSLKPDNMSDMNSNSGTDLYPITVENNIIASKYDKNPVVITQSPIFASKKLFINIWKKLIIDMNISSLYADFSQNYNIPQYCRHSMVVSFASWDEMRKYNTLNYAINVQRSGRSFIHFPMYKKNFDTPCSHRYVGKSICNTDPCGLMIPFLDMRAITAMLNGYMNKKETDGVLLHCHEDYNRMILFIGCCMIQGGTLLDEVMDIMKTLNLKIRYKSYIKAFAEYLDKIN